MNDLDQLFKTAAEQHRHTPPPAVWEKVERSLDRSRPSMVLVWTKRLSFAATLALLFSLGITFWPASTVVEQPPVRIETDGIQPDELQSLPASPKSTPNPEPTHAIEVVSTTRQAPVKQQRSTLTPVQGLSAKSVHLTPTTASVALAEVILTAPTAYPLSPSENKIALPSFKPEPGMISNFLGQTARALGEGATDVVARGVINWEKTKITVNEKFATLTPNNQHNENK